MTSELSDEVLLARAYLNRVAEPTCIPLWDEVRRHGPVTVTDRIRDGSAPSEVLAACAPRVGDIDPAADLAAADRHGIRFVVPESPDWPHFAFACLEAAGLRRVARWHAGDKKIADSGEPIPPLALWVRGPLDLSSMAIRTVGIVGARSATAYGDQVAADMAYALAGREVDVVSGGAYGIDAAAHRGALAATGRTVIVSAGGIDQPYPSGNARLFERAAADGLVVSESPPGAAPRRSRFLTRNRLIAALSTGTVVVEAAGRSGARNTARHCIALGRPVMAVPGPVNSAMSAGCHAMLADDHHPAILVTGWQDVLRVIGSAGDVIDSPPSNADRVANPMGRALQERLDLLDGAARRVFDGLPARGAVGIDRLAMLSGLPATEVIRALPGLEVSGLAEAIDAGFRIGALVREAARESRSAARGRRVADPASSRPSQSPRIGAG